MNHQLHKAHRALAAREEGQGTVEYIGLILLIAAVMMAVVALKGGESGKSLSDAIIKQVKEAIGSVSADKG